MLITFLWMWQGLLVRTALLQLPAHTRPGCLISHATGLQDDICSVAEANVSPDIILGYKNCGNPDAHVCKPAKPKDAKPHRPLPLRLIPSVGPTWPTLMPGHASTVWSETGDRASRPAGLLRVSMECNSFRSAKLYTRTLCSSATTILSRLKRTDRTCEHDRWHVKDRQASRLCERWHASVRRLVHEPARVELVHWQQSRFLTTLCETSPGCESSARQCTGQDSHPISSPAVHGQST